jgi:cellulose synthase (UDP-forming)
VLLNVRHTAIPQHEIAVTIVALAVTFVAAGLATYGYFTRIPPHNTSLTIQFIVIAVLLLLLLVGNIVFLLSRLGAYFRMGNNLQISREEIEKIYDVDTPPALCILIPSYKEEKRVLRQTILSAALAEYPERRIVVLLDDPPNGPFQDLQALHETRAMVSSIQDQFHRQARHFAEKLSHVHVSAKSADDTATLLADLYGELADWIESIGFEFRDGQPAFSHTDHIFQQIVIQGPAADHRARSKYLRECKTDPATLRREIRRLESLLTVGITYFERKQYDNLSHQPNKAMNLNSYISLLGKPFRTTTASNGERMLESCDTSEATMNFPAADYLMTLDADTLVTSDYALRLTRVLHTKPHVAVVQTPYSAIPQAPGILERTAGATTDVQYLQHQGYTHWNATFWVGANAILRVAALQDIRKEVQERGHRISVYIQDHTVIEDTGSTIDLVHKNWTLYNYPARLSYSATPSDFGSLIIQRRRWSNGGLILYPSLVQYALHSGKKLRLSFIEILVRSQYLLSPTLTNGSLLLLFLLPFSPIMTTNPWVLLVAIPYYYMYGRDLRMAGYRWSDLLRVYSLNLLLMPVNLAGVLLSVRQAITGQKSAFGRTPKIEGRTRTPWLHVIIQWGIFAYLLIFSVIDILDGQYAHALFCVSNLIFYFYGITVMIPWRESLDDLKNAA